MQVLEAFFSFLNNIPDAVWGAFVGAGLAFGGVLLTNRNSRLQLKATLDHQARQADRQREMALRRDVYIPAAEAAAELQVLLSRLLHLDTKDKDLLDTVAKCLSALTKVQLVGNDVSVQAVVKFQGAFGSSYAALSSKRIPLLGRKARMESR